MPSSNSNSSNSNSSTSSSQTSGDQKDRKELREITLLNKARELGLYNDYAQQFLECPIFHIFGKVSIPYLHKDDIDRDSQVLVDNQGKEGGLYKFYLTGKKKKNEWQSAPKGIPWLPRREDMLSQLKLQVSSSTSNSSSNTADRGDKKNCT